MEVCSKAPFEQFGLRLARYASEGDRVVADTERAVRPNMFRSLALLDGNSFEKEVEHLIWKPPHDPAEESWDGPLVGIEIL